ncbi:lytic transglycosylase [Silicimonas algicola]|uniref:Transglycosylase-like protein with SLT domain n=1 Tax=Silicimonas algicola TaxID=1826607 RepID=A0A316G3K5_9RHOB|nr:lytic transglycosylase [Silicimonas algicola]PWK55243.1 transglycosylase-like protein with SLT domain [Silicimonas algicola]
MRRIAVFAVVLGMALSSCGRAPEAAQIAPLPGSLWDGRPEAGAWTKSAMDALDGYGTSLVDTVPGDIDTYCPQYRHLDREGRKAFWVTFLSALAKHESTWRPEAAGGGGAWLGLLQISPQTAQGYGCRAASAGALKDGGANLSCGIRIMAVTVPRDGVISAGMRGVAADWGPFRTASKRADIQAATRSQPWCHG